MMTLIIIVLAVLIGFYLYAKDRPDTFRLERSIVVGASPEKVFSLVNDFHSWAGWSPWEKLDPNMKRSYTGTPSGLGTKYAWEGKGQAGSGSMEITASVPSSSIAIDLNFLKPFKARNLTEFIFTPKDGGTEVLWAMSGSLNFMMKVMHIFMNMDKVVGKDFEQGLANLKQLAEQ